MSVAEQIRSAVCRVLVSKLAAKEIECNVYEERSTALQADEMPLLNVIFAETSYNEESSSRSSKAETSIFVEVYTRAESDEDGNADKYSANACVELANNVRSVLMRYTERNLDFTDHTITSRVCKKIARSEMKEQFDTNSVCTCIVEMMYTHEELTDIDEGVALSNNTTQVLVNQSIRGYKYEYINQ